ncbi:hypothetical protein GOODEAATRI_027991 [Goodea atripinnis]|uniref:Uncharacterized protein n=1 Tax=Goodea atripinnis TaxID=208336 RepID=A0ABV0P8F5_9TELE
MMDWRRLKQRDCQAYVTMLILLNFFCFIWWLLGAPLPGQQGLQQDTRSVSTSAMTITAQDKTTVSVKFDLCDFVKCGSSSRGLSSYDVYICVFPGVSLRVRPTTSSHKGAAESLFSFYTIFHPVP